MLEDLGAGELKRIFRFFKNVKNFGTLSLFSKLRTIAVPVVPLAMFGGGSVYMELQSGSAIDDLRVTPVQQVMMQGCVDAHTSVDVSFGDYVSTPKGCACTAKLVSSVTPPAHYGAFPAVQSLAIDQYYWSYAGETQAEIDAEFDARIDKEIKVLANTQNLNQTGLRHMFDYVLSADKICDTRESFEGDSLKSLAALMPLETPIWEGDSEGVIEISLRGAKDPIRVSMVQ